MKSITGYKWVVAIVAALFTLIPPVSAKMNDIQGRTATAQEGGIVLPAQAEPRGYQLASVALTTAAFNLTDHSGTFPDAVDGTPFQGLFITASNTFNVKEGTMFYVPIMAVDNSPPIIGNFPQTIDDQKSLEKYLYSSEEIGMEYLSITVDGKVTSLNHDYLVGVKVPNLYPNAYPGETFDYLTVAAFLSPLKKGTHTVSIGARATGAALCSIVSCPWEFSIKYKVIVH